MAEAVTRALASFAPSYSIICDFRGLEDFTSDVTELLESILEAGATVLAPAPLENVIRNSEEELPDRIQDQLALEEDRADYLKYLGRTLKREIPVLHVRGDETPLELVDVPLEPFADQHYLDLREKERISSLLGDKHPTEQEWDFLRKLIPNGVIPKGSEMDWPLISGVYGHILAGRRAIESIIEKRARNSLLVQYAIQTRGNSTLLVPYHSHAIHQIELRDEMMLGRPAVIAKKTRHLLRHELFAFEQMLSRATVPERELQKFLAEHPAIFEALGYSKIYPHLVLEREDGGQLIPDFMLEPIYDEWWDILDIKVPEKLTIAGTPDRQRFSAAVSELVAQLREYAAAFDDPKLARRVQEKYGVKCYKPKMIGIIGRDDPRNADERELRRLMTSYSDTRLLTFDQLFRVAKTRLLI